MQAILDKCMCYNMLWKFDAKENLSYDYLTGLLYKLSGNYSRSKLTAMSEILQSLI